MEIKCESCGKRFEPSDKDAKDIERAKKQGKTFILITCGACHMGTIYNPSGTPDEEVPSRLLRCPVQECVGFVVEIRDKRRTVWSCGECGSVWRKLESVFREISEIVKKYPYRKRCYRKKGDVWVPATMSKEPANYDDLVEREEPDTRKRLVRD